MSGKTNLDVRKPFDGNKVTHSSTEDDFRRRTKR